MPVLFSRTLVLIMTLLLAAPALAATDSQAKELLRLSGFTAQVEQLPKMMSAGIVQAASQQNAPQQVVTEFQEAVKATIKPSGITKDVSSQLQEKLTDDQAQEVLEWYQSEFGQRIVAAEKEASTAEAYREMVENVEDLTKNAERVEAASNIADAAGATEMAMEFQTTSSEAVLSTILAQLNSEEERQQVRTMFEKQMAQQRPQMAQQVNQAMVLSYLYAYRDFSLEELKKYESFLRTPAAERFNEVALSGLSSALEDMINEFAARLFAQQG